MVKVFLDTGDMAEMRAMHQKVRGFTSNPTLMRKAGVKDYASFGKIASMAYPDMPMSFEVTSDSFGEMEHQARRIDSWGKHVYAKVPITNTRGQSSAPLIKTLADDGVKVNVTAVMTYAQMDEVVDALNDATPSILSIFSGRIADTGRNPKGAILHALEKKKPCMEVLWASTRQVLDIYTAGELGCHIITASKDILSKLHLEGKSLTVYSLETVRMFYKDAQAAGYML
jgi:transaldolase